jgi:hypothetical protein
MVGDRPGPIAMGNVPCLTYLERKPCLALSVAGFHCSY